MTISRYTTLSDLIGTEGEELLPEVTLKDLVGSEPQQEEPFRRICIHCGVEELDGKEFDGATCTECGGPVSTLTKAEYDSWVDYMTEHEGAQ